MDNKSDILKGFKGSKFEIIEKVKPYLIKQIYASYIIFPIRIKLGLFYVKYDKVNNEFDSIVDHNMKTILKLKGKDRQLSISL